MRYQSYYKLFDLFIWNSETEMPYADVLIRPTNETGRLMETLNLHARYTDAGVSIFYHRQYEQLPDGNWSEEISFDHQSLYFTFETKNSLLLGKLAETAGNMALPQKWVFYLTAKNISGLYVHPAVFTQLFTAGSGNRPFSITCRNNLIPPGTRYSEVVHSDDYGIYRCTADLTGLPAGIYNLLLEEEPFFNAYIDTDHSLPGKTGLLTTTLDKFTYGNMQEQYKKNIRYTV